MDLPYPGKLGTGIRSGKLITTMPLGDIMRTGDKLELMG